MPAITAAPQALAANRRRGNLARSEWEDCQRPALARALKAGLELASALDDYRSTHLYAADVTRHDLSAVDIIAGLVDHLSNEVGAAQKRLDDLGVAPELVELDTTALELAWQLLRRRADARLPNPTGPALKLALTDSLAEVRR